jgi:(p)ppGpp synthase/HD superfamily hydrolase
MPTIRLEDIVERMQNYNPDADVDLVRRAYIFSARAHQGQMRLSGESYLVHPIEVAAILAISPGTAKSRLAYGLACLREFIKRKGVRK